MVNGICILVLVQTHPDSVVKNFAIGKTSHGLTTDVLKTADLHASRNYAMVILGEKNAWLISDTYIFNVVYQKEYDISA